LSTTRPSCGFTTAAAATIPWDAAADGKCHAAEPEVPFASHANAPQDVQTAMRLFGSRILDQVDTSVSTVLQENHQMREMANEK
jgi:hypothetical protein